jgi:hypothetical protein
MGPTKGGSSKGRVSERARGQHAHADGQGAGKGGSGANRRDSATDTSATSGGSTLKYRSGDVKRSTGSNAKYK